MRHTKGMTSTGNLLVLNGPNLNLLGMREPGIYGTATLADVERLCQETAESLGRTMTFLQSNHEGELIDALHAARRDGTAGIVINAGGYSHTSVALRDAFAGVELPGVEVHLSNVHAREEFRHHSYLSAVAEAVIVGAGINGYRLALMHLDTLLSKELRHEAAS